MDRGINPVLSDKSPSSSSLETDPGPVSGNGRRKRVVVKLEIIEDCGNQMEVMESSGNSADLTKLPEISNGGDGRDSERASEEGFSLSLTIKMESQPSSSSISSEKSDIYQEDANKLSQPHHGVKLELKDDDSDDCSVDSAKSGKSGASQGHISAASQVSDITHESMMTETSPTQSPPIQTMDRSGGYDPFRIPSSIFESCKSSTPLEWSVASNESLFSIHVGNSSFSRDHVFMFGDSLRLGDVTKPGDESVLLNPPPIIIPPTAVKRKSIELENKPKTADIADTDLSISEAFSESKVPPPVVSWNSSNVTQHSDYSGSEGSTDSFAFPIKKKSTCSSCYCSNCSWAFCYYLRPSCNCCNCSGASCYGWNCSRKRLCCQSSNILADEVPSESSAKKHQSTISTVLSLKSKGKPWSPCCYPLPSCSCCTWRCCFPSGCCQCHRCCHFGKCCSFGKCCDFGSCNFGNWCNFGKCCSFSKCCNLNNCCSFGKSCNFSSCCQFGCCCNFENCCHFRSCCKVSCCCCHLSDCCRCHYRRCCRLYCC